MLEILIGLGNAGAVICIFYCFFQWLDPVAKYVEGESKYLQWLVIGLYIIGMLWIGGSVTEF